jgi:WD40 repeat protein/tRNA A-37 threonylcarbamoyl transferase component Bud32
MARKCRKSVRPFPGRRRIDDEINFVRLTTAPNEARRPVTASIPLRSGVPLFAEELAMSVEPTPAKDLFLTALEKPPAERAAYLDQACGGDVVLRQRVEALVQAHHEPDRLLDRPPAVPEKSSGTIAVEGSGVAPPPSVSMLEETQAETSIRNDDASEALNFLAPPREPNSLGRLDHYDVLEVVGRGGMGVVLKARDTKLQRVVAVKVLAPQLAASGTARKRFVREAQAAAAIRDENVIDIHDVNDDGAIPYLAMEYVCGITLDDRIKQGGPLELKELLRIGIQTAAGLAAAHRHGLIHRDIKPGNILLENGVQRVKITDFGLARAVDDASLTQSGVIAGTPLYMSPEQARGETVDHRSDLFSLGSVLYTLATGHPPFRASNTMAVLKRVCEDTPRPIRENNPVIPNWLCDIIGKLHAKDPAERFQSAAEVANLLSQHLAHLQQPQLAARPAAVTAVTAVAPPRSRRSRLAVTTGLAAAMVLILTVSGIAIGCRLLMPDPPGPVGPDPDGDNTDRPLTAEEKAKLPSPFDGRERAQIPRSLLAQFGDGNPDLAPPEMVAVLGETRQFILPDVGDRGFPARSDDGKLLAVPCGTNVYLYDVQSGERVRSFSGHMGRVMSAAISHDGRYLAGGGGVGDFTARVWDIESGKAIFTSPNLNGEVFGLAFSADNKRLLTGSNDRTGRLWDLGTGKELFALEGHTQGLLFTLFHPDGKHLVTASFDGTVRVWDAETGKVQKVLEGHTMKVQRLDFSPNGKVLASGTEHEAILWNADTWERVKTINTTAGWLAFDTEGKTLLAANHDTGGAVHKLTRWNIADGREAASFTLKSRGSYGLYTLSPDGKQLFAVRDNPDFDYVQMYDTTTGKDRAPQGHTGRVFCVAFSPDGHTLASGGMDRCIKLWDLANWKAGEALPPVQTLTSDRHTDRVLSLAFSPNGKYLASRSHDNTVVLWDLATKKGRTWYGHPSDPWWGPLSFSPDSQTLASAQLDGHVKLWDVATHMEKGNSVRHEGWIRAMAFSPNGELLAVGGQQDHTVAVWDLANEERVTTFGPINDAITDVTFSPDSKTLAWVCDAPDAALRLANLETKQVQTLKGHTSHVSSVVFHPLRPMIATGAADSTVRFWDLSSGGKQVLTVNLHTMVFDVKFSREGRYVAAGNENGTITILKVPQPPAAYDPGPPRKLPDPVELARRPNAADTLKREDIPPELLARAGQGDKDKAPPELVAVLTTGNQPKLMVAFSPDGKLLAVAGDDGIKFWDLATAKLLATSPKYRGKTYGLAFSPDGKLLAACNKFETAFSIWDVATGARVHTLAGHTGNVHRVAFSPDGSLVASAAADRTIRLWEVDSAKIVRVLNGAADFVDCLAFSPDGKCVAAVGPNNAIQLWEVSTGLVLGTLSGHKGEVRSVAFLPDGNTIASSSRDGTIRLWDVATMREKQQLSGLRTFAITTACRADGRLVVADDCENGTVSLWNLGGDAPQHRSIRVQPATARWLHCAALSPEGRYLATANPDGTVYLLRLAEPGEVYEVPQPMVELQPKATLAAHDGAVTWTAFFADGKTLATAGKDGVLKLWSVAEVKERWHITAHDGGVRVLAMTGDGKTLATAGFDGVIRLWDADGKKRHELPGHKGGVAPLLFTANGEQLFSGGADGCVRIWNVRDGKEVHKIDASKDWLTHLSLTPGGQTLATSGNDGIVRLWDVSTGKERTSLPQRHSACFSPDGKRLAVATPEHEIKLLDTETLEVRAALVGHTDRPDSLCFSSDGRFLASCGADGTIRLLDARRGHALALLRGFKGRVWNVALTDDGKTLAAGDEDGNLFLWDLSDLLTKAAR